MTTQVLPIGKTFSRFCKSLAVFKGDALAASQYALHQPWNDRHEVSAACKAMVDALSVDDLSAAMKPVNQDFVAYLRPATAFGKVPGMRSIPFGVRMVVQTGAVVGAFVGEGEPTPVASADFSNFTLMQPRKAGAIVVITQELARLSTPGAEDILAADLRRGIALGLDLAFLDPQNGGSAGTPASITSGATQFSSSGSTAAAIISDLQQMLAVLNTGDADLSTAAWIMTPKSASYLALLTGTNGGLLFPSVGPRGGSLLTLPVITTNAARSPGSPGEGLLILVCGDDVLYSDSGEGEVTMSDQAALQLSDTPADGAAALVPLWQNNLAAIKGMRFLNWARRRDSGVVTLRDVTY